MRPGSANANGNPVGEPHGVPISGTMSPALMVGYLRTWPLQVAGEWQAALPQVVLAKLAAVDLAVAG